VRRNFFRLLSVAFLFVGGPAASGDADPGRERAFEEIWAKVRDRYFDVTFGGCDWNKVHDKYLPQVRQVQGEDDFYRLMDRMLAETGHSHLVLHHPSPEPGPARAKRQPPPAPNVPEGPPAGPGLDVRILDGICRVVSVAPAGSAWKTGLRPGDALEEIDGAPVKGMGEDPVRTGVPGEAAHRRLSVLEELIGPGTRLLALGFRPPGGELRRAEVIRDLPCRFSPAVGNMPSLPVELEARRLQGGVGYVRFNLFLLDELEGIRKAVRGMKDAPGIVLDLRGNPGGMGLMASAVARLFMDREAGLGEMHLRGQDVMRFPVMANPKAYLGPLVILVDETSASTSEILALGLQECGRATVAGSRSAGAALPSILERLDCGLLLQFPIADFHTPRGATLEGKGVAPDVEAPWTLPALKEGKDPGVEAAVSLILAGKARPWPPDKEANPAKEPTPKGGTP